MYYDLSEIWNEYIIKNKSILINVIRVHLQVGIITVAKLQKW